MSELWTKGRYCTTQPLYVQPSSCTTQLWARWIGQSRLLEICLSTNTNVGGGSRGRGHPDYPHTKACQYTIPKRKKRARSCPHAKQENPHGCPPTSSLTSPTLFDVRIDCVPVEYGYGCAPSTTPALPRCECCGSPCLFFPRNVTLGWLRPWMLGERGFRVLPLG